MLTSTLLMLLAALAVVCTSLHFQLLQARSEAAAREAVLREQLEEASSAVSEALAGLDDEVALVVSLAHSGLTTRQIAAHLGVPIAEVELQLALDDGRRDDDMS